MKKSPQRGAAWIFSVSFFVASSFLPTFATPFIEKCNMEKRHSFIIAIILALSTFLTAMADTKPISPKQQRKQDLLHLQELLHTREPQPLFMPIFLNGNCCFDFCMSTYNRKEEDYVADTTAIKERLREDQWILDMGRTLTDKEVKKYKLEEIGFVMNKIMEEQYMIESRFAEVTKFCDGVFAMRREAEKRTMPTGKVKYMVYSEYGCSRPDPVYFEVKTDAETGKLMLYGPEVPKDKERFSTPIGEEVLDTLRQLIETHKIYRELSNYVRPHIQGVPEVLGGPPSWYFNCELEGGKVQTGGRQMHTSYGCEKIAEYLRPMLMAEEERRMNQLYQQ